MSSELWEFTKLILLIAIAVTIFSVFVWSFTIHLAIPICVIGIIALGVAFTYCIEFNRSRVKPSKHLVSETNSVLPEYKKIPYKKIKLSDLLSKNEVDTADTEGAYVSSVISDHDECVYARIRKFQSKCYCKPVPIFKLSYMRFIKH